MKTLEAVADSDMVVGRYNIVDTSDDLSLNKKFELHSIHGNGKIIVSKSKNGSYVVCIGDNGCPASGVASTIRNYLSAQNIENRCEGARLHVCMPPKDMVNFILDFGTFSGFEL